MSSYDVFSGEFKSRLIPTVIYVVNDDVELKFGITNGDGAFRLQAHKYNGYSNVALIRINQPTLLVKDIESIIINELKKEGYKATGGREYYPIECMDIVIDVIDRAIFKWYDEHESQISVAFTTSNIKRLQKLAINCSNEEQAAISLDDILGMLLSTYESLYGEIK